jgi:hypothetical protein
MLQPSARHRPSMHSCPSRHALFEKEKGLMLAVSLIVPIVPIVAPAQGSPSPGSG